LSALRRLRAAVLQPAKSRLRAAFFRLLKVLVFFADNYLMRFLSCLPISLLAAAVLLSACSHQSAEPASANDWHSVALPGKALTVYTWGDKQGRPAWKAESNQSASLWRKRLNVLPQALREVSFSWWVQKAPAEADVNEASRDDAAARVVFAFDGDIAKLPSRTRMMFDLAEALTGEKPPYATLMYVWDATLPTGTVLSSPRTDRIRKIVVDSGPAALQGWRDHRRDLAADFKRAFGEDPGALQSVALMTDSDNTKSSAAAWFGAVTLH
jgi:hypothetical protein